MATLIKTKRHMVRRWNMMSTSRLSHLQHWLSSPLLVEWPICIMWLNGREKEYQSMMVDNQWKLRVGMICQLRKQRFVMKELIEKNDFDGLVLVEIMPLCWRKTKIDSQMEMVFIMQLLDFFIKSERERIMWWVLVIQCCHRKGFSMGLCSRFHGA